MVWKLYSGGLRRFYTFFHHKSKLLIHRSWQKFNSTFKFKGRFNQISKTHAFHVTFSAMNKLLLLLIIIIISVSYEVLWSKLKLSETKHCNIPLKWTALTWAKLTYKQETYTRRLKPWCSISGVWIDIQQVPFLMQTSAREKNKKYPIWPVIYSQNTAHWSCFNIYMLFRGFRVRV